MKILFLFLSACLAFSPVFSNDSTRFNAKGQLVKIFPKTLKKLNKEDSVNIIPEANLQDLKISDSLQKKNARDLLLQKVEEASRIIKSNYYKKSLHRFYLYLWNGDSSSLVKYLNFIETSLKSGNYQSSSEPLFSNFIKAFNSSLSNDKITTFYTVSKNNGQELQLWKTNSFNNFLIDYYNATLSNIDKNKIRISKEEIIESSYLLINEKKQFDEKSKLYFKRYESLSEFNKNFYDSLFELHEKFITSKSTYNNVIAMLREPLFKEWFWLRGGEIRFNPFDGTTESIVKKNDKWNITNDKFIDSIFKNPYAPILEERLDSLEIKQVNNDSILFLTDKLLNKVIVPGKSKFYNISSITEVKYNVDKKSLEGNLRTGQTKTIALHNLLSNLKAGLVEKEKAFSDKSPFQEGLDTVVGTLGELAALYAKFTPFGTILNFIQPRLLDNNSVISFENLAKNANAAFLKNNKNISNKVSLEKINLFDYDYTQKNKGLSFNHELRQKLIDNNLFDSSIFKLIFKSEVTIASAIDKKDDYEILMKSYLTLLTNNVINKLILDSFCLASVIDIYNKSTIPKYPIIKISDTDYVYSTKILETTPSKKAIEKEIGVFTVKGTDTSFVSKFSYNVSQYYRVKLSAGIAYTLTPFNQSVAKQDANGITITNNIELYRLILGVHYYLGKGLYNQSAKFWGKNTERTSLFLGVGIPDPLGNIYLGISRDLLPGLKLTAGGHIVKNNKYLIQNNSIIEESVRYQFGGPFIAIQIDPTSLIQVLNVFK
jgi:hypothetical protein